MKSPFRCPTTFPIMIFLIISGASSSLQRSSAQQIYRSVSSEPNLLIAPQAAGMHTAAEQPPAQAIHNGRPGKKDCCEMREILALIVFGFFILAMMSSYKASPKSVRTMIDINLIFFIEYLHQTIRGLIQFTPWGELAFNTAAMIGILPLHHYLGAVCSRFLLLHPVLPALKELIIAFCRRSFSHWAS